jgi:ferric-dicitrate binding protein FerR (iron transport regulator)
MDKDALIKKWLLDELSDVEKTAFDALDDSQFNKKIIEDAQFFKASKVTQVSDFKSLKNRYDNENKKVVRRINWIQPLLKIAGVAVILVGLYAVFFNNSLTEIQTLASEKINIELPDHSKVILNASSSIAYNKKNWDNNRHLKLDGEAYFKVAKGKTFDIITSDGVVTVVGTQFNVKQRQNYFEVKCFEGIVKVVSGNIERRLLAGETYQIINHKFKEGKISAVKSNWITNMSVFDAVPIKEVFAELERQYNVKLTLRQINPKRLFTGGFTHDNIENALISITQPMNMTYEMNSLNAVIINGKKN